MVAQGISDAWMYWTNGKAAQRFMDDSRIQGHTTIGAAVDAYVVRISEISPDWAGLTVGELEEVRDVLMSYLHLTRGVEWT